MLLGALTLEALDVAFGCTFRSGGNQTLLSSSDAACGENAYMLPGPSATVSFPGHPPGDRHPSQGCGSALPCSLPALATATPKMFVGRHVETKRNEAWEEKVRKCAEHINSTMQNKTRRAHRHDMKILKER